MKIKTGDRISVGDTVSTVLAPRSSNGAKWCPRWESNPHDLAVEGF